MVIEGLSVLSPPWFCLNTARIQPQLAFSAEHNWLSMLYTTVPVLKGKSVGHCDLFSQSSSC